VGAGGATDLPPATVLENLRTGLDRPGSTPERRELLLEKVYKLLSDFEGAT